MSDSDFNTPPWFLNLVRQIAPIGLDPCGNKHSLVAAQTTYTVETDGLAHPWRRHGLVFMNPPHSQSPHNIEPWIQKVQEEFAIPPHYHDTPADSFLGLVPSKTGPAWFQSIAPLCSGRCFMRGRIRFWQAGAETPQTGKFDNLVLYIGPSFGRFCTIFESYGWVV